MFRLQKTYHEFMIFLRAHMLQRKKLPNRTVSALQNRSYEKLPCSLLLLLQFVFFVIRMFDGQAPNIEIITDSCDDIDLDISFQRAVFNFGEGRRRKGF